MDFLQSVQYGQHDLAGLLFVQATALGRQIFGQINALQVIHHQIGCSILFKKAAGTHHVGMVKAG